MFTSKSDMKSENAGNVAAFVKPESRESLHQDRSTKLNKVTIRGMFQLTEEGELQIDGSVEGNIECYMLTLGETGSLKGDVSASKVVISGTHDGKIEARQLILTKTAKVTSEDILVHDSVVMEPEAQFEGTLRRPQASAESPQETVQSGKPAEKPKQPAIARAPTADSEGAGTTA